MGWMHQKWLKDFAGKFFKEHKKAYCFFAAEADKRGYFKVDDGPWGVMHEFGKCNQKSATPAKKQTKKVELEEDFLDDYTDDLLEDLELDAQFLQNYYYLV